LEIHHAVADHTVEQFRYHKDGLMIQMSSLASMEEIQVLAADVFI
jgi:hypothetical protein